MKSLKKISEYEWEIPKQGKMNVPARIFSSEKLMKNVQKDKTLEQVKNVSMLPGIVKASFAMPDAHQGYGFSIGGVAAFDLGKGIISPGGVGYDINCGVRLLASNLTKKNILKNKKELLHQISRDVPKGVGRGGVINLSKKEIQEVLEKGCKWAVEKSYGSKEDLSKIEDGGFLEGGNIEDVSEKAIRRGFGQLGSLGAGNHFLEIQEVEKIYDKKTAKKFGIDKEGQVTIMIHCGSRGLGHQVASDYIKLMEDKYGTKNLPDRELVNAPINSELGKKYFSAMNCAANFGFANRHIIMHFVRESFKKVFPKSELKMVYDITHNIAKIEEHLINGKKQTLCVHRKGATRAFEGQPVLLPGSMGTASYVLVGTKKAEEVSFSSSPHGAGRVLSRHSAIQKFKGEEIKKELEEKGIDVESGSLKGLVEEGPQVYKDVDEVVKVSHEVGIVNLVAKLKPLGVMKG
jgi:tRNA-splicing ligase RtcB (3'-phosphate/5'-hydroxy nucleic acid ligase)